MHTDWHFCDVGQRRTEGTGVSCHETPGPTGRDCGQKLQVRLVKAVKAHYLVQGPVSQMGSNYLPAV